MKLRVINNKSRFRPRKQNTITLDAHNYTFTTEKIAKKPSVLMVGMHLSKTRGGITTLITEILKSKLNEEFNFIYVESQAEDFGKYRKVILAVQAIGKFLKNCLLKRPKVVYVHLGSNASLYRESIFIYLAKMFGINVIAHFHAGDIDNYFPFQNKLGQEFIKKAINLSNVIIAVSEESARQLRMYAASANITVIPNAIDTSAFRYVINKEANEPLKLLFVGAIGKLKGERDLIKALANLKKKETKVKVSILGYGAENLVGYCEEMGISDYIEFLGAVSLAERIKFFEKADVFVLPTYAEAMPMSVIEAMAAGLPVVSTKVGGIPELIEDGIDGFLVNPGDVNALTEKIAHLIENRSVGIKFGEKARQKAIEKLDFSQYVAKLRTLLSEMSK